MRSMTILFPSNRVRNTLYAPTGNDTIPLNGWPALCLNRQCRYPWVADLLYPDRQCRYVWLADFAEERESLMSLTHLSNSRAIQAPNLPFGALNASKKRGDLATNMAQSPRLLKHLSQHLHVLPDGSGSGSCGLQKFPRPSRKSLWELVAPSP